MTDEITLYEELDEYARGFANGSFNLLILVGRGGTGKSTRFCKAIGLDGVVLEGAHTPIEFYSQLRRYKDLKIVVDDSDGLYRNPQSVQILKLATQTEPERRVAYHSRALPAEEREFITSSPIALIFNKFDIRNPDQEALADRGFVVNFGPTVEAVHREAAKWVNDLEIYEFVEDHLPQISVLSMRDYASASGWKKNQMDWRKKLLENWFKDKAVQCMQEIYEDPSYKSQADRVQAWCQETGKDRASFYRLASRYPHLFRIRGYGRR